MNHGNGLAEAPMGKHIALLLPNLTGGGAERVALAIADDLLKHGHRVDLVLMEAQGELLPLVPDGARVIDLESSRIIAALPRLRRYFRKEQPDVVQAHMWPLTVVAIPAHRLARSKARLVVSDHTFLSRHVHSRADALKLRMTTRLFYPLADVRTMCSKAAADDLAQLAGMTRDRIEVIYNPISGPDRIVPSEAAESAWGGDGSRIITIGNLKAVKNHALLVRAFALLNKADARLMILGEGPERRALEIQARELGIADRVILPGFAADPWPFYRSADLFVLSSDYEGYGNVLAEAMLAGLPVVSTDCPGGPREILAEGRYGRLVPVGDAEALAAAIGEALAGQHDPEAGSEHIRRISDESLERYRELLSGEAIP
jgi:glycosyltransferase involved in cell wall biosynthesis